MSSLARSTPPSSDPAVAAPVDGRRRAAGLGLAVMAALGYGSLGVFFIGARHGGMSREAILAWRFVIAMAIVAPLGARGFFALGRRTALVTLAMGAFGAGSLSLCYVAAIERLGAGRAAVLLYLYPGIVLLLDRAFNGRRLAPAHFGAVALGLAGCALTAGSAGAGLGGMTPTGVALGVASAVLYALYLIAGGRVATATEPAVATFGVLLGATCASTVLALCSGEARLPGADSMLPTLGMALFSTVVPMMAIFGAMDRLGPGPTALASTLEMVFAVVLGAFVLGETVTGVQALGASLVLASVIMAQLAPTRVPG